MVDLNGLKVLHDYDNPYISGKWAIKRGILLIVFAISRKIPFLRRFCANVYCEAYEYTFTLHALDQLLGISSIFGINDSVEAEFPGLRDKLNRMSAQVARHWHVSEEEVHWDPELNVPSSQWWFDQEYAQRKRSVDPKDWIVFHCDYPHLLSHYIRCIYALKFDASQL